MALYEEETGHLFSDTEPVCSVEIQIEATPPDLLGGVHHIRIHLAHAIHPDDEQKLGYTDKLRLLLPNGAVVLDCGYHDKATLGHRGGFYRIDHDGVRTEVPIQEVLRTRRAV